MLKPPTPDLSTAPDGLLESAHRGFRSFLESGDTDPLAIEGYLATSAEIARRHTFAAGVIQVGRARLLRAEG